MNDDDSRTVSSSRLRLSNDRGGVLLSRKRLVVLFAAAGVVAMAGCSDLNWHDPGDDRVQAYPHLAPLPPGYADRPATTTQPAATQPATTQAATQAATRPVPPLASMKPSPLPPLHLTVTTAILAAIEHNPELAAQRLNPPIQRTFAQQQRALFDPILTGQVQAGRGKSTRTATTGEFVTAVTQDRVSGSLGVSQFFPTGTTIEATFDSQYSDSTVQASPLVSSRGGITVTQALLQGLGVEVNLASLRQARLDILNSRYQLRGFAASLVQQVEDTYWDYALAQQQMRIVTESLDIAQRQLAEDRELVNVGKLAEVELAAAQAEVALRREDVIDARSTLQTTRLNLLELISPKHPDQWNRQVVLEEPAFVPVGALDPVEAHVAVALRLRPDLNEAKLEIERDRLEIVKTRNGLLPRMDLFITLGKSGYASAFDDSLRNLSDQASYDALVGLNLQLPVGNRDARAADLRAHLTQQQAAQALANLQRLAQVDVRSAYIEVKRTGEQIAATAATRRLQEVNLRNEQEKFRVGKSTSLLVAQVQRDLLQANINEVRAVVQHLQALVNLFATEGSLLQRRGIQAPGAAPVSNALLRQYIGDAAGD